MPQGSEPYLKFESSIRNDLRRILPGAGGVVLGALISQLWIRPAIDVYIHVLYPLSFGVVALLGGVICAALGNPEFVEVDQEGLRVHRGGAVTENIHWKKVTKARLLWNGCWLFRLGRTVTWTNVRGFSNSQWKCVSHAIFAQTKVNRIPVAVGKRAAARWLGQDVHASEL